MKPFYLVMCVALLLSGCATSGTANGKEYPAYGIVNEDARKDPSVRYEISATNVIVAIIFSETVVVPVYVIGWDLWVPVGSK